MQVFLFSLVFPFLSLLQLKTLIFFLEFLGLEIIGSIIFGLVYTLRYGKKSEFKSYGRNYSSTTSKSEKEIKVIHKVSELILADDNTELKGAKHEKDIFDFGGDGRACRLLKKAALHF